MDDIDRFGPKFFCNSTFCTVRPTPPACGYNVAERFYERAYGSAAGTVCNVGCGGVPPPPQPPLSVLPPPVLPPQPVTFVDDAPRYIPARETRLCAGIVPGNVVAPCLPAPVAPGWIEVGYVYSVHKRPRRDNHHHTVVVDEYDDGYNDHGCGGGGGGAGAGGRRRHCGKGGDPYCDVPRYAFAQTPRRSAMPPTRARSRSMPPTRARSRSGNVGDGAGEQHWRPAGGYGGDRGRCDDRSPCDRCDCDECCDKRPCRPPPPPPPRQVHHHYYGGGGGGGGCVRRYRLFARPPYPYGCRAYASSNYVQYAVQDEYHSDGVLVTLDPNPFFAGGKCAADCTNGFNRRWQELCTGDLIRVPGEREPFRVHLFADDFNPPPSRYGGGGGRYYDEYDGDGYYD